MPQRGEQPHLAGPVSAPSLEGYAQYRRDGILEGYACPRATECLGVGHCPQSRGGAVVAADDLGDESRHYPHAPRGEQKDGVLADSPLVRAEAEVRRESQSARPAVTPYGQLDGRHIESLGIFRQVTFASGICLAVTTLIHERGNLHVGTSLEAPYHRGQLSGSIFQVVVGYQHYVCRRMLYGIVAVVAEPLERGAVYLDVVPVAEIFRHRRVVMHLPRHYVPHAVHPRQVHALDAPDAFGHECSYEHIEGHACPCPSFTARRCCQRFRNLRATVTQSLCFITNSRPSSPRGLIFSGSSMVFSS